MARRSKKELIAEFHRLYDIFETLNNNMEPLYGPDMFKFMNEAVITRERMLEWLTEGTATASELVQGTKQGLNDMLVGIEDALEEQPQKASRVLAAYKEQSGRDLFYDAGSPKKMAKILLKRGKIDNDTEFYLLKEVLSQMDQTAFKEPQANKAYELLDDYEMSKSK